jgi:hypothetical protein
VIEFALNLGHLFVRKIHRSDGSTVLAQFLNDTFPRISLAEDQQCCTAGLQISLELFLEFRKVTATACFDFLPDPAAHRCSGCQTCYGNGKNYTSHDAKYTAGNDTPAYRVVLALVLDLAAGIFCDYSGIMYFQIARFFETLNGLGGGIGRSCIGINKRNNRRHRWDPSVIEA